MTIHIKHKPNTNYPNKSRCNVHPDWLKLQWLEQFLPWNWLKLRHSYILHLTPYTLHLTPYTLHLHLHFSMPIENFFAYAILRSALLSAASPASSLGWLVGNNWAIITDPTMIEHRRESDTKWTRLLSWIHLIDVHQKLVFEMGKKSLKDACDW